MNFAHANQAYIRKIRTAISISFGKLAECVQMAGTIERDAQQPVINEREYGFCRT